MEEGGEGVEGVEVVDGVGDGGTSLSISAPSGLLPILRSDVSFLL